MVKVRRKAAKPNSAAQPVAADEKIARILGLLAVRDVEANQEKVRILRSVGFQIADVAALLGITENAVAIADHRARKAKPKG